MSDNKKSYYAIIPASVRYDKNVCPNAKLLYGEITALCNEKGYCWATNDYFAKLYGVTKTSISKWVNSLKKNGYINIKMKLREGMKEIDYRYITIVNGGIKEKLTPPIKEKLKDNTTYINNTINNTKKKESKNDSSTLELKIYKKIIDGFYQYHNKQYDFTSKERGIAKDIAKKLSKYENWYDILKNKVECLNKKLKENPKFWAFTISKLQYGWNEFTDINNSLSNQTEEIINHLQEKKNAAK